MVAPTTFHQDSVNLDAYTVRDRSWWRQKRPYTLILPLSFYQARGQRATSSGTFPAPDPRGTWFYHYKTYGFTDLSNRAYATAFDKLVSKIRGKHTSSLGTSLAEVSESAAMVVKRCDGMRRAVVALKKGRLGDLYDALALHTPAKQARAKRTAESYRSGKLDFSNAYLELSFGWVPMLQDIYDSINVLQKAEFRSGNVKARSDQTVSKTTQWTDFGAVFETVQTGRIRVSCGCSVRVSNPNVALANALGMVNPVSVAWNVIPFSYLVNWFLPVDRFLESFSWDWGFEVSRAWVSYLNSGSEIFKKPAYFIFQPEVITIDGHLNFRESLSALPTPTLWSRVKLPDKGLFGKASTSVAVLVQQLSQRK